MNWNIWIRQTHRWLSIVFTAIVAAIFVTLGMGKEYFLPLFPLALMTLTGLYMFVLPYLAKRRGALRADG
ncbi:hypothetical protein M9M90_10900 [Phenylobacterium sp. LH3H17]|uniref:hypothetical protein n=1 Tax=Phenylobacterium sp. LH3H17 TaxID=2903901 RepID=UPI0020C97B53|nr:hypothetical protein [Phenylobacterium sp. LH3H17]UTP37757.1 hypothetical protein M9M90_10900 [Phenylobacterium sp. LH3H17]